MRQTAEFVAVPTLQRRSISTVKEWSFAAVPLSWQKMIDRFTHVPPWLPNFSAVPSKHV
jgi:hypothetical protein